MEDLNKRQSEIIRTSEIGILTNVMLAAVKAAIGLASHSIAIVLDAVNNLTDVLSSVVTIGGAKLAAKKPDKDHPLGHGRIEYLSALVVAAIVLFAGLTSLVESIKKIIHPQEAEYSTTALIVVALAIVVKLLLGSYFRKKGKETRSVALSGSGVDALSDAALSAGVLITALLDKYFGLSLEAYMGIVISGFIIKAGIDMTSETIAAILGKRANPEVSQKIKTIVNDYPEVRGAYDLFVHDYGPGKEYASIHIELPDYMTVNEVDVLTRKITDRVYRETGVIMTGIGVYSYDSDTKVNKMRRTIEKQILSHDWALQTHAFQLDEEKKQIRIDVVMSFDMTFSEGIKIICDEIKEIYPGYDLMIVPDIDVSD